MVAHALALHAGVDELTDEAAAELRRLDLSATDWQEGLLVWLTDHRDDDRRSAGRVRGAEGVR